MKNNSYKFNHFQIIKYIWRNLEEKRKIQVFLLFLVMLSSGFAESISISAVVPFIAALTDPNVIWENEFFYNFANAIGINSPDEILLPMVLFFGLASAISGLIRIINLKLNLKLAAAVTSDLTVKAYQKTLYQDYKQQISKSSSELISTIITESREVSRVLNYIMLFLTASTIFFSVLITLFLINYKIATTAILFFVSIYLLLGKFSKNKLIRNSKLVTKANKNQMKVLQEGFGSITDVLLKSNQDFLTSIFEKEERLLRARQAENSFLAIFPRYMMESLGLILISILSFILISGNGNITEVLPLLGVLAIAAQRLIPSLQMIYTNWAGIKDRSASVISVIELVEKRIPNNLKPLKKFKPNSETLIKIKSLNYHYHKEKNILKNINLEIKVGEKIGIIGKTGSGKSTLMEILMGLLPPTKGIVELNSLNLFDEKNKQLVVDWRSSIAYVPQNIFLSDVSIKENIAFGLPKEDIDINRVKLACKAAHIDEYIDIRPNKYEALVGERGISLSGGQCQRIGIARALYENKDILFLDEATSSIDTKTEKKIIESIKKLYSLKTIFMVAHRTSTLIWCDKVIELDNGEIVKIHGKEWINKNCK